MSFAEDAEVGAGESVRDSALQSQAEFAAFLIAEFFSKPSKVILAAAPDDTDGLLPRISFECLLPRGDLEQAAAFLCDETRLLEERCVQRRRPFHLPEKPLLIPAVLAALLHRILCEKAGIFVSSTTFDAWASAALGFPARTSRLWLDACDRVDVALARSSAKDLVPHRSTAATGAHAIQMQAADDGLLMTLWTNACAKLCASLEAAVIAPQEVRAAFVRTIERALATRRRIASMDQAALESVQGNRVNLHATGEPELCSCVVFQSFFCELERFFRPAVQDAAAMDASAQVTFALFVGCLNVFTYHRYSVDKVVALYDALDAVATLVRGKRPGLHFNLRAGDEGSPTRRALTATLLSCDDVFGAVQYRHARKEGSARAMALETPFAELNSSYIQWCSIYPLSARGPSGVTLGNGSGNGEASTSRHVISVDDEESYIVLTLIHLGPEDDGLCAAYLLSPEEAASKRKVLNHLHGKKRVRGA